MPKYELDQSVNWLNFIKAWESRVKQQSASLCLAEIFNDLATASYRGMIVMQEKIQQGDIILSIPFDALINKGNLTHFYFPLKEKKLKVCAEMKNLTHCFTLKAWTKVTELEALYCFILIECKKIAHLDNSNCGICCSEDSERICFFREYFGVLPSIEDFQNMPCLLPKEKLEVIFQFDCDFVEHVMKQKQEMSCAFRNVRKACRGVDISKDEFLWAYFCVSTRCVSTYWRDCTVSLAPFFEMINHSSDGVPSLKFNSDSHAVGSPSLDVIAHKEFLKGEEMFLRYGAYSNRDLLFHYGFKLPDNVYNSICLDGLFKNNVLKILENESLLQIRMLKEKLELICDYFGLDSNSFCHAKENPWKLEAAMYLLLSPTESVEELKSLAENGLDVNFTPMENCFNHEIASKLVHSMVGLRASLIASSLQDASLPVVIQEYLAEELSITCSVSIFGRPRAMHGFHDL